MSRKRQKQFETTIRQYNLSSLKSNYSENVLHICDSHNFRPKSWKQKNTKVCDARRLIFLGIIEVLCLIFFNGFCFWNDWSLLSDIF